MSQTQTNVTGIQGAEEEKKDQNEGVTQETIKTPAVNPYAKSIVGAVGGTQTGNSSSNLTMDNGTNNVVGGNTSATGIGGASNAFDSNYGRRRGNLSDTPKASDVADPVVEDFADPVLSVVEDVVDPVVEVVPKTDEDKGLVDFSKLIVDTEEQRNKSIAELEEDAAVAKQNAFNRLTHDSLAQQRNSGALNATKMATIRRANNLVFDGKRAINAEFTKNIIELSKEQALADADFNGEEYRAWASTRKELFDVLFETDPDAALELGRELARQDPNAFGYLNNETYLKGLKASSDVKRMEEFNSGPQSKLHKLALNTGLSYLDKASQMDTYINAADPDLMSLSMSNHFQSLTEKEKAQFGISKEDSDVMEAFIDGGLDMDDSDVRAIYKKSFIADVKEEEQKLRYEANFKDDYNTFQGTEMAPFIDKIIDANVRGDSSFSYDGTGFKTFGSHITGDNWEDLPGIGHMVKDWDGDEYYKKGYTREAAEKLFASKDGSLGELTNGNMDELYTEYIDEQDPNSLASDVMNVDAFGAKVKDVIADLKASGRDVTKETVSAKLEGSTLATDGSVINKDQYQGEDGLISFSSHDVNIDDFTENQAKDVAGLFDKSITLAEVNIGELLKSDPNIFKKLAKAGKVPSYSNENMNLAEILNSSSEGNEFIARPSNTNNNFTGNAGFKLFNSLDGTGNRRQGRMVIGGHVYSVVASPSYKSFKGNDAPAIKWKLTPISGDGNNDVNETTTIRGTLANENNETIRNNIPGLSSFDVSSRMLNGETYDEIYQSNKEKLIESSTVKNWK